MINYKFDSAGSPVDLLYKCGDPVRYICGPVNILTSFLGHFPLFSNDLLSVSCKKDAARMRGQ